jgi:phytoene dehydrogenase-like protein
VAFACAAGLENKKRIVKIMEEKKKYDAIIVGAGVGGLTVGTLLAKDGLKVLVLEQNDRPGGRALSVYGKEISDKGLEWYKKILASQYTYIANSQPDIETIIKKRMLDGFTMDIGYHAISANGAGYMLDFEDQIGGLPEVAKHGAGWGNYFKGKVYHDVAGSFIDPNLKRIAKEEKIPYLSFYMDPHGMSDEEIDKMEKVSFKQWADDRGISKNEIIFDHLHSVSTLFSTINDPNDISMGDIFRYFKHAFGPKILRGVLGYVGGFVENGTMEWSKAIVSKLESYGGEIIYNAKAKKIMVEESHVTGVIVDTEEGEKQYSAAKVVSNVPAQFTFKLVDPKHFPADLVKRTEAMYGYGSYVPYMGLNKLVMPEEESRMGIKNTCILPKSEGYDYDVYICWNIQSVVDPTVAPAGKYLYTAYIPLTENESRNKVLVDKLVKRLPEFMEEVYPGFKESIDWKMDLVCWKLEGVAKSISQAGTQKVPVKSPHVEGLYFAGDTAKGYGVAMDCAIASGMICAGSILGKDFGIK